jgi:hypothetical protein
MQMAKGSVPELTEVSQLPVHHLSEGVQRLATLAAARRRARRRPRRWQRVLIHPRPLTAAAIATTDRAGVIGGGSGALAAPAPVPA